MLLEGLAEEITKGLFLAGLCILLWGRIARVWPGSEGGGFLQVGRIECLNSAVDKHSALGI